MKNKIFKSLGAVALVGLTACSLTSCSFSDVKSDIKDWFNGEKEEPTTTDEKPIVDGTTTDVVDGIPTAVLFKKASINTSLTINATVTPADATNKTLTWSLAYADGSSASDIGNYIISTVSSDTHTVTLAVSNVFSKQILLKCRTVDGIETSTTIDIVKQVKNIKIDNGFSELSNGEIDTDVNPLFYNPDWLRPSVDTYSVCDNVTYDVVGTIGNVVAPTSYTFSYTSEFLDSIETLNMNGDTSGSLPIGSKLGGEEFYYNLYHYDELDDNTLNSFYNTIQSFYSQDKSVIDISVNVCVIYNSKTINYECSYGLVCNGSPYVKTTSVSLNKTDIVIE